MVRITHFIELNFNKILQSSMLGYDLIFLE